MEISSFGAKANLTPKIRTDLSGQAKDAQPSSASHTQEPFSILQILGWRMETKGDKEGEGQEEEI